MTGKTRDDVDLYVRDPRGNVGWCRSLQAGALSLDHDTVPGVTDPAAAGDGVPPAAGRAGNFAGHNLLRADLLRGVHESAG